MIHHFSVHGPGNAGDCVLTDATRRALLCLGNEWISEKLEEPVTAAKVKQLNKAKAVVIGGGGLFISDTKPTPTGWRWNCTPDMLAKIKVPIVVYAVGYNRFRGQPDFSPAFSESIAALVEKAAFFSMRDSCSPEQMRPYIGDLADKIIYQPCPAAVASYLYPEYANVKKTNTLAFVPAMDRAELRGVHQAAPKIVRALKEAQYMGCRVKVVSHIQMDSDFWQYIRGTTFEIVELWNKPAADILKFYSTAGLVIGMRLHSAVIPFGFGCPIIPIISHDKLTHFLNDIEYPEWGVNIDNPDLTDELVGRIIECDEVDLSARERLWQITQKNSAEVSRVA